MSLVQECSRWFPAPDLYENSSAEVQRKAQLRSRFKDRPGTGGAPDSPAVLSTPCERFYFGYLTRGKVWAAFTGFTSPGSEAKAELPEQETLSSACGWKLGHAPVPRTGKATTELRTVSSFPNNKMFLPLNMCNGYHVDNKTYKQMCTLNVTILTALIRKVL